MRSRWLLVGLAVSLALNLFFVGLLAARLLPGDTQAALRPGPMRAWAGLPAERRREIRGWLVDQGARARADLQAAREHRRRAAALFASTPYDPQAVVAELDQATAVETQVRQRVQREVAQYAARLSPEERRAVGFMLVRNPMRAVRAAGGGPQQRGPRRPAPGD